VALPHGWLPSGTQPQYGGKSATGAHVVPDGQLPPHENGPPPQGGMVVVVVIGGGRQPLALHASQQLACWPTQRAPVQREASRFTAQRTRGDPTRQQVTAPGRPQVDRVTQRRNGFTHSDPSMLPTTCA
jgi:hypothetical protein